MTEPLNLGSSMKSTCDYVHELAESVYTQVHSISRMQTEAASAAQKRLADNLSASMRSATEALAVVLVTEPAILAAARARAAMGLDNDLLDNLDTSDMSEDDVVEFMNALLAGLESLNNQSMSTQLYTTAALCLVMTAERRIDTERNEAVTHPQSEGGTEGDPLGVEGE